MLEVDKMNIAELIKLYLEVSSNLESWKETEKRKSKEQMRGESETDVKRMNWTWKKHWKVLF